MYPPDPSKSGESSAAAEVPPLAPAPEPVTGIPVGMFYPAPPMERVVSCRMAPAAGGAWTTALCDCSDDCNTCVATAAAAAASLARRSGSAETPRSKPRRASTYAATANWDEPASLDDDAKFDVTMAAPLRTRPPRRQQPPEDDRHRNASGRGAGDGARRSYPIPSPATRQSPTHQTLAPASSSPPRSGARLRARKRKPTVKMAGGRGCT
ncbi:hypothetical protein OsI_32540 [Oryza sativa Indica Group]|uniref:Uncharacterized protein n=1 Tax=Oryza sativa subsp. indica TaxID=39946 RepID=B8BFK5_ORYSI|nr:hypothetical protein OsI_32540 [Oryza sativa Indica Group]